MAPWLGHRGWLWSIDSGFTEEKAAGSCRDSGGCLILPDKPGSESIRVWIRGTSRARDQLMFWAYLSSNRPEIARNGGFGTGELFAEFSLLCLELTEGPDSRHLSNHVSN